MVDNSIDGQSDALSLSSLSSPYPDGDGRPACESLVDMDVAPPPRRGRPSVSMGDGRRWAATLAAEGLRCRIGPQGRGCDGPQSRSARRQRRRDRELERRAEVGG